MKNFNEQIGLKSGAKSKAYSLRYFFAAIITLLSLGAIASFNLGKKQEIGVGAGITKNNSVLHYFENPQDLMQVWDTAICYPKQSYSQAEIAVQQQINEETEDGISTFSPYSVEKKWTKIDFEEITPFTWKWIDLDLSRNGAISKISLRRPNWWFKRLHADSVGKRIYLDMPEMGITGFARINKIRINQLDTRFWNESREGEYVNRPITGKFEHESDDVYRLLFGNNANYVGVTGTHAIWSTDRNAWVKAQELRIGENVKTKNGSTILKARNKLAKSQVVYNLEVYKDHNFLVSTDRILVHNDCWDEFTHRLGNAFDYIGGKINVVGKQGEEILEVTVGGMKKAEGGLPGAALEKLTQVAERTAKESGINKVKITFGMVYNESLKDVTKGAAWAAKYGYKFSTYVDEVGLRIVTWEKPLK